MPRSPLTHAELARALETLRLGMGASDLHGSLTGYLCAGGSAGVEEWPAALELEPDAATLRNDALRQLYRDCRAQLDDPDLGFEPLLPAHDVPVERRADALVEWCRGFLGGVGLSGAATGHALSPDANEVLADLGRIASTHFAYEDAEEDESALSEVLEFVRVGVLLLHAELLRPRTPARRLH